MELIPLVILINMNIIYKLISLTTQGIWYRVGLTMGTKCRPPPQSASISIILSSSKHCWFELETSFVYYDSMSNIWNKMSTDIFMLTMNGSGVTLQTILKNDAEVPLLVYLGLAVYLSQELCGFAWWLQQCIQSCSYRGRGITVSIMTSEITCNSILCSRTCSY